MGRLHLYFPHTAPETQQALGYCYLLTKVTRKTFVYFMMLTFPSSSAFFFGFNLSIMLGFLPVLSTPLVDEVVLRLCPPLELWVTSLGSAGISATERTSNGLWLSAESISTLLAT